MVRLVFSLLFLTLDARLLHGSSSCGTSLLYLRLDAGTRTIFKIDLERVAPGFRARAGKWLESDFQVGPLKYSNRSYYACA